LHDALGAFGQVLQHPAATTSIAATAMASMRRMVFSFLSKPIPIRIPIPDDYYTAFPGMMQR